MARRDDNCLEDFKVVWKESDDLETPKRLIYRLSYNKQE